MKIEALAELGLSKDEMERWRNCWEQSQRSYPADGVYFIQEDYLREIVAVARLRSEAQMSFYESGSRMRSSEALSRLAWHCHWLRYVATGPEWNDARQLAFDFGMKSPQGCTFFMSIVFMAGYPRIKAYYLEHGIPLGVLSDTLTSLDIWTEDFHDKHGEWGCFHAWIVQGIIPTLFRIGRLEFQFGTFCSDYRIYRSERSGEHVMLAPFGVNVTGGYCCLKEEHADFTTYLREDGDAVCGYPVGDDGRISATPVSLGLDEWKLAFRNGDKMINIHIPAAAPLDGDLCVKSIELAREFFERHFPEFDYRGFQCISWLLDSSLPEFLPASSNIVRFQKNFHLFPFAEGNAWQIRERVFGNPDLPLEDVPQRTSLQRTVKKQMLSGHQFRSGSGIIYR